MDQESQSYEEFERDFLKRFLLKRVSPYKDLLQRKSWVQRRRKERKKTNVATPRIRLENETSFKKTCQISYLCRCEKCLLMDARWCHVVLHRLTPEEIRRHTRKKNTSKTKKSNSKNKNNTYKDSMPKHRNPKNSVPTHVNKNNIVKYSTHNTKHQSSKTVMPSHVNKNKTGSPGKRKRDTEFPIQGPSRSTSNQLCESLRKKPRQEFSVPENSEKGLSDTQYPYIAHECNPSDSSYNEPVKRTKNQILDLIKKEKEKHLMQLSILEEKIRELEEGGDSIQARSQTILPAIPNDAMPEQSFKDIQVDEMINNQTQDCWIEDLDVDLMKSILELEDKMQEEGSVISDVLKNHSASDILEHIERHPEIIADEENNLDAVETDSPVILEPENKGMASLEETELDKKIINSSEGISGEFHAEIHEKKEEERALVTVDLNIIEAKEYEVFPNKPENIKASKFEVMVDHDDVDTNQALSAETEDLDEQSTMELNIIEAKEFEVVPETTKTSKFEVGDGVDSNQTLSAETEDMDAMKTNCDVLECEIERIESVEENNLSVMKSDCSLLEHEIKSTESVEEINLIAQLNTIEDGKSQDVTNELEASEVSESDVRSIPHLEAVDSNETNTTESEVLDMVTEEIPETSKTLTETENMDINIVTEEIPETLINLTETENMNIVTEEIPEVLETLTETENMDISMVTVKIPETLATLKETEKMDINMVTKEIPKTLETLTETENMDINEEGDKLNKIENIVTDESEVGTNVLQTTEAGESDPERHADLEAVYSHQTGASETGELDMILDMITEETRFFETLTEIEKIDMSDVVQKIIQTLDTEIENTDINAMKTSDIHVKTHAPIMSDEEINLDVMKADFAAVLGLGIQGIASTEEAELDKEKIDSAGDISNAECQKKQDVIKPVDILEHHIESVVSVKETNLDAPIMSDEEINLEVMKADFAAVLGLEIQGIASTEEAELDKATGDSSSAEFHKKQGAPYDVIQAEDAVTKTVLERNDVLKNTQFENPTVNSPHISHSSDSEVEILEQDSTSPSSIEICDVSDSEELTDSARNPPNIKENSQDDAASCGEDTFTKNILKYESFRELFLLQGATFGKKNNAKESSDIYLALESFQNLLPLITELDIKNNYSAIPELIDLCNKHLHHLENQENKVISKITTVENFRKRLIALNGLIKYYKLPEYLKINARKNSVCGPDRGITLGRLNTTSASVLQTASYDTIQNSNIEPEFSKMKSVLKTKRYSSTEEKRNLLTSNIDSNSLKSDTLSNKKGEKLNNCIQRLTIMKEPEKIQMLRDSECSVSMPPNLSEVLSQKHLFSASKETAAVSKTVDVASTSQSNLKTTSTSPLQTASYGAISSLQGMFSTVSETVPNIPENLVRRTNTELNNSSRSYDYSRVIEIPTKDRSGKGKVSKNSLPSENALNNVFVEERPCNTRSDTGKEQQFAFSKPPVPPSNQSVISSAYQEPLNFAQSSHTLHYNSEKEQQFSSSKPSVPLGNQRTISPTYEVPLNLSQNRHYNSGLRPPSSPSPPQIPCHTPVPESLRDVSPPFSLPPPFQWHTTVPPHHDVPPSTSDTVVRRGDREPHSSSQPNSFVRSSVAVRTDISFSEQQISLVQNFINYRNLYAQNASISNTPSIQNNIPAYSSSQSCPLMPCDPSLPSSNLLHLIAQSSSNVTQSTYGFPHLSPTVVPSSPNFQPSSTVSRSPHALNRRAPTSSNLKTLRHSHQTNK